MFRLALMTGILTVAAGRGQAQQVPMAGQGIMVGEVTATSAIIQLRMTTADKPVDGDVPGINGCVTFELLLANGSDRIGRHVGTATASNDQIARIQFSDLKPGTDYRCRTILTTTSSVQRDGPTATFRTLHADQPADATFVVVTGMNYAKFHGDSRIDKKQHLLENNTRLPQPYRGPDKHLGYPALASILKLKPDFFVGTGDNVYYDTPDKPRAETVPQLRQKWHQQFVQPRYRDLFSVVPTYWMIDDHDYRIDDGDNSGDYRPTPAEGRRLMLEQLPVAPHYSQNAKTYRTHRIARDLQVWFPENRMYRSNNADPDGPKKTIWGSEQKAWLKETLLESDATFKLLISPTPMVGPDDARKTDNHTNIGGFQHERDEFFAWLKHTGLDRRNFYIVCGDRHWQYHAIHPAGIEEFSCGALVDANSRLGRKPGDPASTDPKGLIQQPYSQDPRSGGFLQIALHSSDRETAELQFVWHDEHGKVLHEHIKRAP